MIESLPAAVQAAYAPDPLRLKADNTHGYQVDNALASGRWIFCGICNQLTLRQTAVQDVKVTGACYEKVHSTDR